MAWSFMTRHVFRLMLFDQVCRAFWKVAVVKSEVFSYVVKSRTKNEPAGTVDGCLQFSADPLASTGTAVPVAFAGVHLTRNFLF